ncbi:unnamed protein product [Penicillium glandicola]
MRYSIINSLLLLAVSPLSTLALPVDPNDQTGQWDPSGQYRKGNWQHGVFIANDDNTQNNQNAQTNQNSQVEQGGWTDSNGQWHSNDGTVQTATKPNDNQNSQNGWTDSNGKWHANNENAQNNQGWTDANGQWHANQKREVVSEQAIPTTTENGVLSGVDTKDEVNSPQATPSSQNSQYQSYGNYKNYGSYQNYPTHGQNQAQDKDTKAVSGQQE